jgi:transposase InsO family protein
MVPLLLYIREGQIDHGIPMERFYRYVGISRQGFSKAVIRFVEQKALVGELRDLVKSYRKAKDRRAGSRSLFHNLGIKSRFGIGVNKFEHLMSENGLILPPLSTRVVTTRSSMQSWNYPNLVNGLVINDINQAVAGDLTYVYIMGQRYFLFCLTDLYSARIVGIGFGPNMRAENAKEAMDDWVGLRKKKNLRGCIHHTDGGTQYFSGLYLNSLGEIDVRVSCAENCLMNGYAEQRNGLIKHHLIPTVSALDEKELYREIKRIIRVYNHDRKQEGLGWLSPVEFEEKISGMSEKPDRVLHKFTKNKNGFWEA